MTTRFIVSMIVDDNSQHVYDLVTSLTLLIQVLAMTLSLVNALFEWPLALIDLGSSACTYLIELIAWRPYMPYMPG